MTSTSTPPPTTTPASVRLEHVNVTVSDPDATARLLGDLFGWQVRWRGGAKDGGTTVHVGTTDQYVALYTPPGEPSAPADAGSRINGLNHLAVVVEDLDEIERRAVDAGLTPFSHSAYEPGRRFYLLDGDGIEYEVVSYR